MASLKAIRRRIASAKSTQQITRATEAGFRRAAAPRAGSAHQRAALQRSARREWQTRCSRRKGSPSIRSRARKSDRCWWWSRRIAGLAGGYNSYLLRAAEATMREIRGSGLDIELFAVGKKAVDQYRRTNVPMALSSVDNFPRLATIAPRARHRRQDARRLQLRRDRRGRHRLYAFPVRDRAETGVRAPAADQASGRCGHQAGRRGRGGGIDATNPRSTTWSSRRARNWCRSCCAAIWKPASITRCSSPRRASRARAWPRWTRRPTMRTR